MNKRIQQPARSRPAADQIVIYTTPTCQYCKMAKTYLRGQDIDFVEKDVTVDEAASEEMFEKTGQMGVPVILVTQGKKEHAIIGYNRPQLERILRQGRKVF